MLTNGFFLLVIGQNNKLCFDLMFFAFFFVDLSHDKGEETGVHFGQEERPWPKKHGTLKH